MERPPANARLIALFRRNRDARVQRNEAESRHGGCAKRDADLVYFVLIGIMSGRICPFVRDALRQHLHRNRATLPTAFCIERERSVPCSLARRAIARRRSDEYVAAEERNIGDRDPTSRTRRRIPQQQRRIGHNCLLTRGVGIVSRERIPRVAAQRGGIGGHLIETPLGRGSHVVRRGPADRVVELRAHQDAPRGFEQRTTVAACRVASERAEGFRDALNE